MKQETYEQGVCILDSPGLCDQNIVCWVYGGYMGYFDEIYTFGIAAT